MFLAWWRSYRRRDRLGRGRGWLAPHVERGSHEGCTLVQGGGDICVEDVPECQIDEDYDVKVKLHWCGICGSDLHEYLMGPIFILPFVSWPSIT